MTNDKKDFFFLSCPPLLLKVKTYYSITLFRIPDDVPYYPPRKIYVWYRIQSITTQLSSNSVFT